jgi:NAD(P)-dependent dehydrogenase (short-subunit alcohol dehydrogenase family)
MMTSNSPISAILSVDSNISGVRYKALVIGSSGALGNAFVNALRLDPDCELVETIARSQNSGFDLSDEASIVGQADRCSSTGPFKLIIDATGALTIAGVGPEKSLKALDSETLIKAFQINTIGPALIIKHFAPLLEARQAIYAKLSARVGSISDNRKGGWYGYRASKAALNMMLQTAAIELQRKRPDLIVAALQPGTVDSALSKPFTANVITLKPAQSVAGMLNALRELKPKFGAHFVDYQGQEIEW